MVAPLELLRNSCRKRRERKNAACCFEQILEAPLNKTGHIPTLLTSHPSNTNKTCWALLVK